MKFSFQVENFTLKNKCTYQLSMPIGWAHQIKDLQSSSILLAAAQTLSLSLGSAASRFLLLPYNPQVPFTIFIEKFYMVYQCIDLHQ